VTLAALLLDLGDTLVHEDHVIAHVLEALDAVSVLHVAPDTALPLALVSDYTMAPPGDAAEVARLVAEYVTRLSGYGLLRYFQPTARHVTLSTEVGVRKPDPAIFREALVRLGGPVALSAAMFITEDEPHIAAARRLGMTAWQLGVDVTDWSQLPLLVARAIDDTDPGRLRAAYALRMRVLFHEQLGQVQRVDTDAHRAFATLSGEPPQDVVLDLDACGDITALRHLRETPHERSFRAALEDNDAIAAPGEPLAPGQTHQIEPDPTGAVPRRKRFSIT
jgi:beta-phosphoglucomutase-like phosphatase (HAD superfamily)